MTTRINGSVINQTISRAPTSRGGSGPLLLTKTDCDHVAAAGSKLGGSTEGRDLSGNPPARSA